MLSYALRSSHILPYTFISSQIFSDPLISSQILPYTLISSQIILYPLRSSHIISYPLRSSQIISYHLRSSHTSHIFSYPLISSHILSDPLWSSHILSDPLISSHIFSYPLRSSQILSDPISEKPKMGGACRHHLGHVSLHFFCCKVGYFNTEVYVIDTLLQPVSSGQSMKCSLRYSMLVSRERSGGCHLVKMHSRLAIFAFLIHVRFGPNSEVKNWLRISKKKLWRNIVISTKIHQM